MTTIEENKHVVMRVLVEAPRNEWGNAWLDAKALAERTNLDGPILSDVSELLERDGWAKRSDKGFRVMGFTFVKMQATPEGRSAFENLSHTDSLPDQAPTILRNLKWLLKYGRRNWPIVLFGALIVLSLWLVNTFLSAGE